MPTSNVRVEYAEWLATPPVETMLVETMEIGGQGIPHTAFANRVSDGFDAIGEDGAKRNYLPLAFEITKPAIRAGTQMTLTAQIDGVGGAMLEYIASMPRDSVRTPLLVWLRSFLFPTMLDRPVWNAPLVLRCEEARVTVDIVELTLVGGRLPTKRAGTYYDISRFVTLRPY